jgi:hypothetical protein
MRLDNSGSSASILADPGHVRFAPDSDNRADILDRQLRAKDDSSHRNK